MYLRPAIALTLLMAGLAFPGGSATPGTLVAYAEVEHVMGTACYTQSTDLPWQVCSNVCGYFDTKYLNPGDTKLADAEMCVDVVNCTVQCSLGSNSCGGGRPPYPD